jgi:hypothetical protein
LDCEFCHQDQKKIALLQICVEDRSLVFQIHVADRIPDSLKQFLQDEDHIFVSVAMGGDYDKLQKDLKIELSNIAELQA